MTTKVRPFTQLFWIEWGTKEGFTEETMKKWLKTPTWICPECKETSKSKRPLKARRPLVCIWFPKCPGIMVPKVNNNVT